MSTHWKLWIFLSTLATVRGGRDIGFGDDSDLTSFITRPDIKAPILDVKVYDPDAVTPGYFFVAPYTEITQRPHPKNYYQACQTGPTIYDGLGNLIWSGACLMRNQNACDFRVINANGSDYLSVVMYKYMDDTDGHGAVWNQNFELVNKVEAPFLSTGFNMHELLLLPSSRGLSAIHLSAEARHKDLRVLGDDDIDDAWVLDTPIYEVDVATGEQLFEWWPLDHIGVSETTVPLDKHALGPWPDGWNWFHGNSIDKNQDGDYLLSSRWTNAIYKISSNGTIEWRLGGTNSTFALEGFNFSRQHDARWLSHNDTVEIISFLDNASSPGYRTANTSSALIVSIDKKKRSAHVVSRIWRPDGNLTMLRGNYQASIGAGNSFVGWSDNGYMSEHIAGNGRMVLEARFRSKRFVTYRSYKFNFTGTPSEESPTLKSYVYGVSTDKATTAIYASWNGATEVTRWDFFNGNTTQLIGSRTKTSFETAIHIEGYIGSVYAEAVNTEGNVLGRSNIDLIAPLPHWDDTDNLLALDSSRLDSTKTLEKATASGGGDAIESASYLVNLQKTEL